MRFSNLSRGIYNFINAPAGGPCSRRKIGRASLAQRYSRGGGGGAVVNLARSSRIFLTVVAATYAPIASEFISRGFD